MQSMVRLGTIPIRSSSSDVSMAEPESFIEMSLCVEMAKSLLMMELFDMELLLLEYEDKPPSAILIRSGKRKKLLLVSGKYFVILAVINYYTST